MTLSGFRRWLETQLEWLKDSDSFNQDDWTYAQQLVSEARDHAFALRLPKVAGLAIPGPPRQRLAEIFAALPEPDYLTIDDVAERLRISTKTVRRRISDGSIPKPQRIGAKMRWRKEDFDG